MHFVVFMAFLYSFLWSLQPVMTATASIFSTLKEGKWGLEKHTSYMAGERRSQRSELIDSPLLMCYAAAAAKSLQSCPTLCDPMDCSPPGSSVHGILQARTLEWVAISFSNAWKWKVKVKSLSRVRPSGNPMDCSLPGSSIHGIFQATVLEWDAIAFSPYVLYDVLNVKEFLFYEGGWPLWRIIFFSQFKLDWVVTE